MDTEKQLSEKESLELITRMINKAKEACHDTGITAIMWGIVIVVCSLVRYAELKTGFRLPFDIFILTFIAVIPQIYFTIREKKQRKARSYDDTFMDAVWLAFGISIALLIFINTHMFRQWDPVNDRFRELTGEPGFKLYDFTAPFFLLLYGVPTFITGVTMRFRPMLWGGLLCWAACIAAVYTDLYTDLLLLALSAAGAWLIPGILLEKDYRKAKKQLARTDV